jgi:hypothetical protein
MQKQSATTCPRPPACGRGGGPPRQAPPPCRSRFQCLPSNSVRSRARKVSNSPGRPSGSCRAIARASRGVGLLSTVARASSDAFGLLSTVARAPSDAFGLFSAVARVPPDAFWAVLGGCVSAQAAALGGVGPRHARRSEAADRWVPITPCMVTRDRESADQSYEAPVVSSRSYVAGRARWPEAEDGRGGPRQDSRRRSFSSCTPH